MHTLSIRTCFSSLQNLQACIISRLTFVSFIVVLTFTVCIIHEFTFILNYNVSRTTSDNSIYLKRISLSGKQNHSREDWRKVTDNVYIYSAYWDTRLPNESFVRIIGGLQLSGNDLNLTKCLLKINNSSTIFEVPIDYEILIEHHNKPSRAVYIKCLLPDSDLPTFAAVVPMGWNDSWANKPPWLAVQKLQDDISSPNIGVCVRPMFNFSDIFRISEFIAYYEALGVSHFTFYNYDASEEVIQYLNELTLEGYSIDILPWTLPQSLNSMWALGQIASINDCMYRNMKEIMYVAVVDLDEFITPRHVMTLHELLLKQDVPSKSAASFVLRSCVFCAEYKPDVLPSVILPFKTQTNIRREKSIYPFLIRSKYIAKPYFIEVAGVHCIWRIIPGWEERFVPASQAIVHHYREKLCIGKNKTLEEGEIDVKSRKYLNPLMRSKAVAIWKKHYFISGA